MRKVLSGYPIHTIDRVLALRARMVLSRVEKAGNETGETEMSKKWFVFAVAAMLSGSAFAAEKGIQRSYPESKQGNQGS
jgi:hypothetical protein